MSAPSAPPIPRFMGWVKPATVTEALERCLEHARVEEKWSYGQWFETGLELHTMIDDETWEDVVTPESHDYVVKEIEGQTCTDVKACSAGIVAIEVLDGEALYHYLRAGEEMDQDALMRDPIARGALEFLAEGFRQEFEAVEDGSVFADSDPISCIVHFNDRGLAGNTLTEHHGRIVRSFEKGLELSRAADATKGE
jgi:hypothetical protein